MRKKWTKWVSLLLMTGMCMGELSPAFSLSSYYAQETEQWSSPEISAGTDAHAPAAEPSQVVLPLEENDSFNGSDLLSTPPASAFTEEQHHENFENDDPENDHTKTDELPDHVPGLIEDEDGAPAEGTGPDTAGSTDPMSEAAGHTDEDGTLSSGLFDSDDPDEWSLIEEAEHPGEEGAEHSGEEHVLGQQPESRTEAPDGPALADQHGAGEEELLHREEQTEGEQTEEEQTEEEAEQDGFTPTSAQKKELETLNLDSLRLIIGSPEAPDEGAKGAQLLAWYDGVGLVQFDTLAHAQEGYFYYREKAEYVTPDTKVQTAGGDNGHRPEKGQGGMSPEDNPIARLKEQIAEDSGEDHPRSADIALIDTGADSGAAELTSLLGDDGRDENGHGSRMAAYILEENPSAEILSIKAVGNDGSGDVSAIIAAVKYALSRGAKLINLSVSAVHTRENEALTEAIKEAGRQGVPVIGAAGSQGRDVRDVVPGSIEEAVIAGSCGTDGLRIAASNYGAAVDYNVVSDATSEAAARLGGILSLSPDPAAYSDYLAGMLNQGKVFETAYVPAQETAEEAGEEDGTFYAQEGDETAGTGIRGSEILTFGAAYRFGATRLQVDMGEGSGMEERLTFIPAKYTDTGTIAFRVSFALNGKGEHPAGAVRIVVPAHIFRDSEGNCADSFQTSADTLTRVEYNNGVKSKSPYMYYYLKYDESGELTDTDVRADAAYVVFTNYEPIGGGANGYVEVSYTTTRQTQYYHDDVSDLASLSAGGTDISQWWSDPEDPQRIAWNDLFSASIEVMDEDENGNEVVTRRESEKIPVYIDTSARIYSTAKRNVGTYRVWNSSWGPYPYSEDGKAPSFDDDEYVYAVWRIMSAVSIGTQNYDFSLAENPVNGEIIAYSGGLASEVMMSEPSLSNGNMRFQDNSNPENTGSYSPYLPSSTADPARYKRYIYRYVLTRHKKEDCVRSGSLQTQDQLDEEGKPVLDGEGNPVRLVTSAVYDVTDNTTGTVTPEQGMDRETSSSAADRGSVDFRRTTSSVSGRVNFDRTWTYGYLKRGQEKQYVLDLYQDGSIDGVSNLSYSNTTSTVPTYHYTLDGGQEVPVPSTNFSSMTQAQIEESLEALKRYTLRSNYQHPVTLELVDDLLFLDSLANDESSYDQMNQTEGTPLKSGDYQFTSASISYSANLVSISRSQTTSEGQTSYRTSVGVSSVGSYTEEDVVTVWGKYGTDPEWKQIWTKNLKTGAVDWDQDYLVSVSGNRLTFQPDCVGLKANFTSKYFSASLSMSVNVTLLRPEHLAAYSQGKKQLRLVNVNTVDGRYYDENGEAVSFLTGSIPSGYGSSLSSSVLAHDVQAYGEKTSDNPVHRMTKAHGADADWIVGPVIYKNSFLGKRLLSCGQREIDDDDYLTASFEGEVYEVRTSYRQTTQKEYIEQRGGVLYDLLPLGARLDESTFSLREREDLSAPVEYTDYTIDYEENYKNSGRTLAIITLHSPFRLLYYRYSLLLDWEAYRGRTGYIPIRNTIAYESGNDVLSGQSYKAQAPENYSGYYGKDATFDTSSGLNYRPDGYANANVAPDGTYFNYAFPDNAGSLSYAFGYDLYSYASSYNSADLMSSSTYDSALAANRSREIALMSGLDKSLADVPDSGKMRFIYDTEVFYVTRSDRSSISKGSTTQNLAKENEFWITYSVEFSEGCTIRVTARPYRGSSSNERPTRDPVSYYGYSKQHSGTFYDLLPIGGSYIPGTISVSGSNSSSGSNVAFGSGDYDLEITPNFRRSGRTQLKLQVNRDFRKVRMSYKVRYPWESVVDYTNRPYNSVAYETGNDRVSGNRNYGHPDNSGYGWGYPDDPTYPDNADHSAISYDKHLMTDLDPYSDEERFVYAQHQPSLSLGLQNALLGLTKTVQGDNGGYSDIATTGINKVYSYRLRYVPDETVSVRNMILFDSLENYSSSLTLIPDAQTGGLKQMERWKGTFEDIDISQPQGLGIDVHVYYSETENLPLGFSPAVNVDVTDGSVWKSWTDLSEEEKESARAKVKALAIDLRYADLTNEVFRTSGTPTGYDEAGRPLYLNLTGYDGEGRPIYHNLAGYDAAGKPLFLSDPGEPVAVVVYMKAPGESSDLFYESGDLKGKLKEEAKATNQIYLQNTLVKADTPDEELFTDQVFTQISCRAASEVLLRKVSTAREPLFGAKFRLRSVKRTTRTRDGKTYLAYEDDTTAYNNTVDREQRSDLNGMVRFRDIEMGTYLLEETEASAGYARPLMLWEVTVDRQGRVRVNRVKEKISAEDDYLIAYEYGEAADPVEETVLIPEETESSGRYGEYAVVENEPAGSFTVRKMDETQVGEEDAAGLAGAVLKLSDKYPCGSRYGRSMTRTATTNRKGILEFTDIEQGEYILEELAAPTGYITSPMKWEVSIDRQGAVRIEPLGYVIREEKEDSLSGYEYVYHAFEDMEEGEQIPAGAQADPLTFDGETGIYTLTNRPKGAFKLRKREHMKPGDTDETPLSGAVFRLSGTSEWGNPLGGAGLGYVESASSVYGLVYFNDLEEGSYELRETIPPEGFAESLMVWRVIVDANGRVQVYRTGREILAEDENGLRVVSFEPYEQDSWILEEPDAERESFAVDNNPIGSLTVEKVSLANPNRKLPGVSFTLSGVSWYGNTYGSTPNKTQTNPVQTEANGRAVFPNIEPGVYLLEETVHPALYKAALMKWEVEVSYEDGSVKVREAGEVREDEDGYLAFYTWAQLRELGVPAAEPDWVTVGDESQPVYTIYNEPYGQLSVKKWDPVAKKALQGVSFRLSGTSEYGTEYGSSTETSRQAANGIAASDRNGMAYFRDIEKGEYELSEILGAEGHVRSLMKWRIRVDENGTVSWAPAGQITDVTETVGEGEDAVTVTKKAFAAYGNDSELSWTVLGNESLGTNTDLVIDNDPLGVLRVKKVDSMTRQTLYGARFTLTGTSVYGTEYGQGVRHDPDQVSGTYKLSQNPSPAATGSNGTVVFSDIEPGENYILEEILGAAGHERTLMKWRIRVDEDGTVYWAEAGEITDVTETTGEGEDAVTVTRKAFSAFPDDHAVSWQVLGNEAARTNTSLEIDNVPLGMLRVKKLDSVTGQPLAGVYFTLNGKSVYGTDYGQAVRNDVNKLSGSYKLNQNPAPSGTDKNGFTAFYDIEQGDDYILEEILGAAGHGRCLMKWRIRVDENGTVSWAPAGQITDVTETVGEGEDAVTITKKAFAAYENDSELSWTVLGNAAAGTTTNLEINNDPLGVLRVRKLDSVTDQPLAGVRFTLTGTSLYGTAYGEGIRNDENRLDTTYKLKQNPSPSATGDNGMTVFTDIEPGEGYILEEILGAEGHERTLMKWRIRVDADGTVYWATAGQIVDVTETTGEGEDAVTQTRKAFSAYPDDHAFSWRLLGNEAGDTNSVLEIDNNPLGVLRVKKVDSATGQVLSGVRFTLTGKSAYGTEYGQGVRSDADKLPGTYRLNQNPAPSGTDSRGTVTFSDIEPGENYMLEEVLGAAGYQRSLMKWRIRVDADGTVFWAPAGEIRPVTFTTGTGEDAVTMTKDAFVAFPENHDFSWEELGNEAAAANTELEITNDPLGVLRIKKTDSVTNRALQDVWFSLTGTSDYGTVYGTAVRNDGDKPGTVYRLDQQPVQKTAANGTVSFKDIERGEYDLEEIIGEGNHQRSLMKWKVRVDDTGTVSVAETGTVRIVDPSSSEGGSEGGGSGASATGAGNITLGQKIFVPFEEGAGLEWKTLSKTSGTADFYYGIENAPLGVLRIQKIDALNRRGLSGVRFSLTGVSVYGTPYGDASAYRSPEDIPGYSNALTDTQKAALISRYTLTQVNVQNTGTNGYVSFADIEEGVYVLEELVASAGHQLSRMKWYVRVDDTGNVYAALAGRVEKNGDGILTFSYFEDEEDIIWNLMGREVSGSNLPYTIKNEQLGRLTIKKTDVAYEGYGLRGAEFTLEGTSDYGTEYGEAVRYRNAEEVDLSRYERELANLPSDEARQARIEQLLMPYKLNQVPVQITDDGGRVTFHDIEEGTYTLTETAAPGPQARDANGETVSDGTGYQLSRMVWDVRVSADGSVRVREKGTLTNGIFTPFEREDQWQVLEKKNDGQGICYDLPNDVLAAFSIRKIEAPDNDPGPEEQDPPGPVGEGTPPEGKPLMNVTFRLTGTAWDGTVVDREETTGADGIATFARSNDSDSRYGIPQGEYVLTEVSTASGYKLPQTARWAVTIHGDGSVTMTGANLDNLPSPAVTLTRGEDGIYRVSDDGAFVIENDRKQTLHLSKEVRGNLGDLNRRFEFEVNFSNLRKDTDYTLTTNGQVWEKDEQSGAFEWRGAAEASEDSGSAGDPQGSQPSPGQGGSVCTTTFRTDLFGRASVKLRLKNTQWADFTDLAPNVVYNITEAASNHVAEYEITHPSQESAGQKMSDANEEQGNALSTGDRKILYEDTRVEVAYTNTRTKIVDAGVLFRDFRLLALLLIAAGGGLAFMAFRKKRRARSTGDSK